MWGYTKHGDAHITVTPATDYPRAFVSFPRIAGSGNEIAPPPNHLVPVFSCEKALNIKKCKYCKTRRPRSRQPRTQDLSLGKTLAAAGHVPHQKFSA